MADDDTDRKLLNIRAMKVLSDLRDLGELVDCKLCTEDGSSINVHRTIMAACSSYFRALFTSPLNAEYRSKVTIPGISFEMLSLIVEYAYTRNTRATELNVTDLLSAADQFNILGMIDACCRFMLTRMEAENCIGINKFAKQFNCVDLEKDAYRFLMTNFVDVVGKSKEFLKLPVEDVIAIINSEDLNISKEEFAWEAVVKWIDVNPDERRHHIVDLMRCVRLGLLNTKYFMERVKVHPYIENNELCKPVVIETLKFLYDLEMITQRTGEVPTPMLARPRVPYEIMFAIGGWSGGSPTSIIETYDTRADRWITIPEVDPAGPRAYHKCAVVLHDIYVIGGFDGIEYFNSCRCFNAVTKKWREVAPMHSRRCYVSVAVVDNIVYAMGGYNGHHRQNTAEKYDHKANQWTFIAPMNAQRSDACASTLNGFIYVTGGFDGTECLNSCESYNPQTDQWTVIASMRSRRSGVSCIAHNGHLFAIGGFNGMSRLSAGEKYNPMTDSWTQIPDMFNPRSNFAIEVIDDMIFVMGGYNGVSIIHQVECYPSNSREWFAATSMSYLRSAVAGCVIRGLPNAKDYYYPHRDNLLEEKRQRMIRLRQVIDDMIFVIGGFNGSTTIFQVECYDDDTREWLEATDMNVARSAVAACVITGLTNVRGYVYQNRHRLMEEKRLKLIQIQDTNGS